MTVPVARRLALALTVGAIGALSGLAWGHQVAPVGSKLVPMYGAAGALIAMLALRVVSLGWMIWSDFFGRPKPPPEA